MSEHGSLQGEFLFQSGAFRVSISGLSLGVYTQEHEDGENLNGTEPF